MRALFLVLLLANLLFLAWSRWVAPAPDIGGRATPASPAQAGIRLMREASPGAAATPAGPPATCVSGGPYLDRPAAEQAAANLAGLGYTSRLRASRDQVWVGQWVRIDDLATPDDAQNVLATLKAAGVRLVNEEPFEGAHGCLVAFVHPAATGGVLLELSQPGR